MFNTIEEAIADIKLGKMVVVVDDENRENEGDLVMAADLCRTEDLNFMVTKARGLVCVPIGAEQAKRLQLNQMVENNTDAHGTAFTVSVDHMIGTTTGISAAERAITAIPATTRRREATATTGWWAARTTTCSSATRAATWCSAIWATTPSMAEAETTPSGAARGTTPSQAATGTTMSWETAARTP